MNRRRRRRRMRTRRISIKYDLSSLKTTSTIRECSIIILFAALLLPSHQYRFLPCNGLLLLKSKTLPTDLRNKSSSSRSSFLLSTTVDDISTSVTATATATKTATAKRLRKSKIEKDGGIIYRQSVCSQHEMELIQKETSIITKHHLTNERSSIAQNRLGAALSSSATNNNNESSCDTLRMLKEGGSIYSLVQRLTEVASSEEALVAAGVDGTGQTTATPTTETTRKKIQLCQEIPIEVRSYEKIGASMSWHKDECLYDPPQFEIIFTVENNSDCVTMWKKQKENNDRNKNNDDNEICTQETHPNSLLLLQAGPDGPDHCVTSLKHGRRVILKCAYIYEGSTYIGGEERNLNQFDSSSKNKMNKRATTKSKSDNRKGKRRNSTKR
jgi:hypothetical protein